MRYIFIFIIFYTSLAIAGDNWLCTEESSQRRGDEIHSCGIGLGKDENEARSKAFENANAEFRRVCNNSRDCNGHEFTIDPKRTVCEQGKNGFKCIRLVIFSIAGNKGDLFNSESAGNTGASNQKIKTPSTSVAKHKSKKLSLRSPAALKQIRYIRRGMTKGELLTAFGMPDAIEILNSNSRQRYLSMRYSGSMCVYSFMSCYVTIGGNWVTAYSDFKPKYTEYIKSELEGKSDYESQAQVLESQSGVLIYDISGSKAKLVKITPEDVTDGVAVGIYSFPKGPPVRVISPDGEHGTIDPAEAHEAFQNGYTYDTAILPSPPKVRSTAIVQISPQFIEGDASKNIVVIIPSSKSK